MILYVTWVELESSEVQYDDNQGWNYLGFFDWAEISKVVHSHNW